MNVTDCHARNWGGSFYPAPKTGDIEFVRIRVVGCTADLGAAVFCVAGGPGSNMTTSVTDSAFYNCSALSSNAGFAYVFQNADFVMSSSLISGCTSTTEGGALFATSARLRWRLQPPRSPGPLIFLCTLFPFLFERAVGAGLTMCGSCTALRALGVPLSRVKATPFLNVLM